MNKEYLKCLTQFLLIALLILLSNNYLYSQLKVVAALIKEDSSEYYPISADTLGIRSGRIKISDERQAKSGNLAMLLSAILPGAGQIYAHRYYTIPIIWGCGIYFSSVAIKSNNYYEDYRSKFSESVKLDTIYHRGDDNLKRIRDFYRNQRDEFIIYLGLTYILNIVDAYVGATLYNFDVSDELGGRTEIRFRIPLN